jgi:hypothetical protein
MLPGSNSTVPVELPKSPSVMLPSGDRMMPPCSIVVAARVS